MVKRDISTFLLWATSRMDQGFYDDMVDQGVIKDGDKVVLLDDDCSTSFRQKDTAQGESWFA